MLTSCDAFVVKTIGSFAPAQIVLNNNAIVMSGWDCHSCLPQGEEGLEIDVAELSA